MSRVLLIHEGRVAQIIAGWSVKFSKNMARQRTGFCTLGIDYSCQMLQILKVYAVILA